MLDWLAVRRSLLRNGCISAPTLDPEQLQTSHIVDYDPSDFMNCRLYLLRLVSAATYSNYTKRRRGLPCNDAIPTGGQLTRITRAEWPGYELTPFLVWSSQSFLEGKYPDVSDTPLVGPKRS